MEDKFNNNMIHTNEKDTNDNYNNMNNKSISKRHNVKGGNSKINKNKSFNNDKNSNHNNKNINEKYMVRFNKTKLITLVIAIILLATAIGLINDNSFQNGEKNIAYYKAKVLKVVEDKTEIDKATEGVRRGSQKIELKITEGPYKGEIITIDNYISALFNIYTKTGTRLILRTTVYEDGPNFSVYNYDRTSLLYGFILLFMVFLSIIGGKKGFMSIVSLVLTLIIVFKVLLPLLIQGYPTISTTIIIIILTIIISFILIDGINVKTTSAALGTILGVNLAGLSAYLVGIVGHLSGFQMEEAETLLLIAGEDGLRISNLLVCGILISSLGAVMDVAISIASSIHELRLANTSLEWMDLFKSGMNIGKDAMGTMTNTLILAFTGSSLNLMLMIYSYGIPYSQLINTDTIAIEIIRAIAGSIGIVLTVPMVAYISARIETKKLIKIQN